MTHYELQQILAAIDNASAQTTQQLDKKIRELKDLLETVLAQVRANSR